MQAIDCLKAVVDVHDTYTKAIFDLTLAYERAKEYTKALDQLDRLRRLQMEDTRMLVARGRIYAKTGWILDAEAKLHGLLRCRSEERRVGNEGRGGWTA